MMNVRAAAACVRVGAAGVAIARLEMVAKAYTAKSVSVQELRATSTAYHPGVPTSGPRPAGPWVGQAIIQPADGPTDGLSDQSSLN